MISEKLLCEVLNISPFPNHDDQFVVDDNCLVLSWSGEIHDEINIYELAHKCKEWAYPYGYTILSSTDECYLIDREGSGLVFEQFYGNEPEAIFKACQWILEHREPKDY